MRISNRLMPVLLPVAALLSACAVPQPGPNAAAAAVQAPPDVPLATHPTQAAEAGAVAQNDIEVTFPVGMTALTPVANRQLDLAARLFRDANPVAMFVAGHADTTGDEFGNVIISARRAQTVKEALVARGIGADRLLIQAFGTSDPADAAHPSAPANRRVVITWRLL